MCAHMCKKLKPLKRLRTNEACMSAMGVQQCRGSERLNNVSNSARAEEVKTCSILIRQPSECVLHSSKLLLRYTIINMAEETVTHLHKST